MYRTVFMNMLSQFWITLTLFQNQTHEGRVFRLHDLMIKIQQGVNQITTKIQCHQFDWNTDIFKKLDTTIIADGFKQAFFIAKVLINRCFRATGMLNDIIDRKSTRLNSSHVKISYAVFCLKKKS